MNLYEDNDSDLSRLNPLKRPQPIRSFIEQEVDGGEVGLESVFLGEYLEVRLFQFQVCKDGVRAFGWIV